MSNVPSKKPRIQCYISEDLKVALDKIAGENNISLSELAGVALEEYAIPDSIKIKLESKAMARFKQLSMSNYRPVKDQATMIIMEWIAAQDDD